MAIASFRTTADFTAQHRVQKVIVIIRTVNLAVAIHAGQTGKLPVMGVSVTGRSTVALLAQSIIRLFQKTFINTGMRSMTGGATLTFR